LDPKPTLMLKALALALGSLIGTPFSIFFPFMKTSLMLQTQYLKRKSIQYLKRHSIQDSFSPSSTPTSASHHWKQYRESGFQYMARWWYDAHSPFNATTHLLPENLGQLLLQIRASNTLVCVEIYQNAYSIQNRNFTFNLKGFLYLSPVNFQP
jgi:hypothetical protein